MGYVDLTTRKGMNGIFAVFHTRSRGSSKVVGSNIIADGVDQITYLLLLYL